VDFINSDERASEIPANDTSILEHSESIMESAEIVDYTRELAPIAQNEVVVQNVEMEVDEMLVQPQEMLEDLTYDPCRLIRQWKQVTTSKRALKLVLW
jgi:alpha-glucuronidase